MNPAQFPSLGFYGLEMQKNYTPRNQREHTVEGKALEFCVAQDHVPAPTSWETLGWLLTFSVPQSFHCKGR